MKASAADATPRAVSAISKRLAQLEDHLGAVLLERKARGVRPTAAGELLLRHARGMFESLKRLQDELGEHAGGDQGQVRLLASSSSIVEFLPDDIAAFLGAHKRIDIDLQEMTSGEVVSRVEKGDGDICVCCAEGLGGKLEVYPYRRDSLVVVVRTDHQPAGRKSVAFAETLAFEIIGLHASSAIVVQARKAAAEMGHALRHKLYVPSFDGLCRMVQAGVGIGIVPAGVFGVATRGLGLKALPLTDDWAQRDLHLVMADRAALTGPAELLVRHLLAGAPG